MGTHLPNQSFESRPPKRAHKKDLARGSFFMLRRASKLLCLRAGIEQRSHIFLVRKIDELVPRQNFLTKKF